MKPKEVFLLLALIAVIGMTTTAYAADDFWNSWFLTCSAYSGNTGGHVAIGGVSPDASDNYGVEDMLLQGEGPYAYAAFYHENGVAGWTGPTGFYDYDYRAPVPLAPGSSKDWLISVWANPAFDPSASLINFDMLFIRPWPQRDYQYTLTLVKKPAGIDGGPAEGSSWDMSYGNSPNWSYLIPIPVYRTDDGLAGYLFELKATAVPEPSAFAALACGLVGVLSRTRKRRSL